MDVPEFRIEQETMRWENTSPIHGPLPIIIFFNLILALRGYFRKDAWLVSCNDVMTELTALLFCFEKMASVVDIKFVDESENFDFEKSGKSSRPQHI